MKQGKYLSQRFIKIPKDNTNTYPKNLINLKID